MKKVRLIAVLFVGIMVLSCNQPSQKETDKTQLNAEAIQLMEQDIQKPDGTMDITKANKLLKKYDDIITRDKGNPLRAEYLFKAGNLAMNINKPNVALRHFENLLANYPKNPKAEQALFLRAFVLDNSLKEYEKAETAYKDFIKKYPRSEFADDAKASLQYLGKSPEELIKEFEKKNKQ